MHVPLFNRLALSGSFDTNCSRPVSIEGNNAAQWEAVVFTLTASAVSFQLQESNDMENWTPIGSAQSATAIGHKLFTADKQISAAFVRLKVELSSAGTAILAAGVSIAPL